VTELPCVAVTSPAWSKRKAKRKASVALALTAPATPAPPATPAELAERLHRLAATLQALSKEPSWSAMHRGVALATEEAVALAGAPGLGR